MTPTILLDRLRNALIVQRPSTPAQARRRLEALDAIAAMVEQLREPGADAAFRAAVTRVAGERRRL